MAAFVFSPELRPCCRPKGRHDGRSQEAVALPEADYDLIVSIFDAEIVNDVVGFLARLRAHLRPDGLLLVALLGGATLTELQQVFLAAIDAALSGGATARVAPFIQLGDAGSLLQRAGLKLPVTDVETRHTVPVSLATGADARAEARLGRLPIPLADRAGAFRQSRATSFAAASCQRWWRDSPPIRTVASRRRSTSLWLSGWAAHTKASSSPSNPGSANASLRDGAGRQVEVRQPG